MQVVGFNIATKDIKATSNKLPYLQSCQHPEKDWWHKAVVIGGNVVVVLNVFAPLELCQHTSPTLEHKDFLNVYTIATAGVERPPHQKQNGRKHTQKGE